MRGAEEPESVDISGESGIIVTGKAVNFDKPYEGIRKPESGFSGKSGVSTLDRHFADHGKDFGCETTQQYYDAAKYFFEKSTTDTTMSFVTKSGTYFRYDTATNEFGIINCYGGISTYFKPLTGLDYWLTQVKLYMETEE